MSRVNRKPPHPPHWGTKMGRCRYCGKKAPSNRHRWHQKCADEWKVMNNASEARKVVFRRDGGRCANCPYHVPRLNGDWQVDHLQPLMFAGKSGGRSRWLWAWLWKLDNMQTLCPDCHTQKTREDIDKYGVMNRPLTNDQSCDRPRE